MTFTKTALASALTLMFANSAVIHAASSDKKETESLELTVINTKSIKRDATIEKVDAIEIDAKQISDAEDLVRYIPGVNVSKGDDRWGASGYNIRGLDEDRVAIIVDGVPQGETLKNEGGQAYGYFKGSRNGVDIEALKRVNIIKGADAILSGNGALSGAAVFTTKDPADLLNAQGNDTHVGVKLGYSGDSSEKMGSLSFANRTGDLETLVIYTKRDRNEFESFDMKAADIEGAGREVPDPQDGELKSLLAKAIYHFTDNTELGFVASQYETDITTNAKSFNGGWYTNRIGNDNNEVKRLGLFFNHQQTTPVFDRVELAFNDQSSDFAAVTTQHVEFNFGPTFRADEDRISGRSFNQDFQQFTLDLVKTFDLAGQAHELTYGYEWLDKDFVNIQARLSNSKLNDLGWQLRNIGGLIPKAESTSHTLYALDTFNISADTEFRLGMRYDDISYDAKADDNFADPIQQLGKIDFSAFTWTLGIEQQLTDNMALEAGVSTGFRTPTIEELYITSGTSEDWTRAPNKDLDPEYATNFDIAVLGEVGALHYRVGVFYSDYKDFINNIRVERIVPETGAADKNGYLTPTNASGVEMKGVELELDLDLAELVLPGLRTTFELAYTDGEEDNGVPVYSVQPLNAVWSLGYNGDNWGVATYANYSKGKDNEDSYKLAKDGTKIYPLYLSNTATIIDVIAHYHLSEHVVVRAGVKNLTDKEYFLWDNVRFVDQADLRPGIGVKGNGIKRYSEPGRNFEVSVNVTF